MRSGDKEFWRVVNASADSLLDLQIVFDALNENDSHFHVKSPVFVIFVSVCHGRDELPLVRC
jgi:hypothetical protein